MDLSNKLAALQRLIGDVAALSPGFDRVRQYRFIDREASLIETPTGSLGDTLRNTIRERVCAGFLKEIDGLSPDKRAQELEHAFFYSFAAGPIEDAAMRKLSELEKRTPSELVQDRQSFPNLFL